MLSNRHERCLAIETPNKNSSVASEGKTQNITEVHSVVRGKYLTLENDQKPGHLQGKLKKGQRTLER